MRTENIIPISIANGTSTGTGNLNLEAGRVVGVMQFSSSPNNNHNNKGMVRAEVLVNGRPVAQLQPVDNLRSRNVPFLSDGKPIADIGGNAVQVNIIATQTFDDDTEFDFVFIYAQD